ncbi:uncharacterized protein CLUP02_04875 [Colletotrichum lupini]|uniref:Uncharacterized protein n=1 Tax=Colletotrichum lupini TaxID=145971 RepID=A0A9Q8SL63_9PEZI|nr:uncharacterized protein CLUP02_04875 [Colletotrichum lupini]UQC79396.1 hypothetical protein CLUP02_04875 [Colletotrichum lupini]
MVTVQMRRDVSHVDDDDQKTIMLLLRVTLAASYRGFLEPDVFTFAVTIATPHKKTGNIYGITIPYCVIPN